VGGKHLDPEKITKMLHIFPDFRGKRGEPVAPSSRKKSKAGSWGLESDQWNWRIETQMRSILKRIAPAKERLRRLIRNDATVERAYLTIAFSPPAGRPAASYLFPAGLINEFASLGLDIVLSIYFYDRGTSASRSPANSTTPAAKEGGRKR
jgi:hypothetical protein